MVQMDDKIFKRVDARQLEIFYLDFFFKKGNLSKITVYQSTHLDTSFHSHEFTTGLESISPIF